MSIELFLILLIILSSISGLLTEAIKKWFENKKNNPSANLIAVIDGGVVGGLGTAAAYVWLSIPFTLPTILAIVAMMFAVGVGSMIGYDKIIQLVKQINGGKQ